MRSETSWILPPDKVVSLKKRFSRIYVWLDADTVGKEGTQKMKELYGFTPLYHDIQLGKDLSDIYKKHGEHNFRQIANSVVSR